MMDFDTDNSKKQLRDHIKQIHHNESDMEGWTLTNLLDWHEYDHTGPGTLRGHHLKDSWYTKPGAKEEDSHIDITYILRDILNDFYVYSKVHEEEGYRTLEITKRYLEKEAKFVENRIRMLLEILKEKDSSKD